MPRGVLRRRRGLADGALLFGLAALFGIGAVTVRRFERAAGQDVAARLDGPEKRVQLRVVYPGLLSPAIGEIERAEITASNFRVTGLPFLREPWRSSRGRIARMTVDLREFELTGLGVARMTASIPDVRYDLAYAARHAKIRISRAGTGTAAVELRPEAIAKWLMVRSSSLRDLTGRIEDGQLGIRGRVRFAGFEVPFDVLSRVGGEGPRLTLEDPTIRLAGVEAKGPGRDELVRTLNPVVDVDRDLKLGGAVSIRRVDVRGGRIVASGSVSIPEAAREGTAREGAAREGDVKNGAAPRR